VTALGALGFLAPFWLAALAALPILWWLLRVTPPAPRRLSFPAIRLLLALRPKEETPARTPWWLLLLRLVIAALVILALAHPLLNPSARLAGTGPLILVVDDGWAAARNWPRRKEVLSSLVDRADREDRSLIMLATAPSIAGDPPRATRLMAARELRPHVDALEPKPWPVDRAAAATALDAVAIGAAATIVYLGDGLDDPALAPFLDRLQHMGAVEMLTDPTAELARMLLPPAGETSGLAITAHRPAKGTAEQGWVRATAEDGRLLGREELRWAEGEVQATAKLTMPTKLRNRVARLEVEGESSAGTVVLMDERWRRRPVGLVSGGPIETVQPLLADVFYLERALNPYSEVRQGTLADLLRRELSVIVLADVGQLNDADRGLVDPWVRKGGILVRFAGPRMAESTDDLVPVTLRSGGGRAFGGAMSWSQPVGLARFEAESPFAGLTVPEDVRVMRQVLAEPSLDLTSKTWARLSDGTPLVTADKRGEGWIVLVHTTANPEWSSLAISGLFVEMLQRVVSLSQGVAGDQPDMTLAPTSALDGYGRLQPPPPVAGAIPAGEFAKAKIGPRHPPGLYGRDATRRALNLSAVVPPPVAVAALPAGVAAAPYAAQRSIDFRPWLFAAALLLSLIDLVIGLALRGLIGRGPVFGRGAAAALAGIIALGAVTAEAQTRPGAPAAAPPQVRTTDADAMTATLTTRLAHVLTGNQEVDEIARAGLAGLGAVLTKRTAVEAGEPIGIDVETDEIGFYPLVYWPIAPDGRRPSTAALARINAYLRQGGNIIFDTREGAGGGAEAQRLREILRALNLPPLTTVPAGHVLTKAFYLLQEFPGRWAGAPVWVEQPDERVNDGVSSVIIGAHDWAAAWATDAQGRPQFAAVPGGEAQRETAVRFGVNLVMYALTGNYKADQVHIDAILERLKR